MLHHRPLKPRPEDYPPNEWSVVETNFRPEFMAQLESILALGNGYLGMRGSPEEGGPSVQNGTFVNGFYESWPIIYGEEAFGFAHTGQTMLNVTDAKIIRLFVDDEPFELVSVQDYSRELNMKCGTLDRKLIWEMPSGKQVRITSRRLVSFPERHVAAISYEVNVLNAAAAVVIASGICHGPSKGETSEKDPRKARFFARLLKPLASQASGRRIILVHGTEESKMILACGIDHEFVTDCPYTEKTDHTDNSGEVVFTVQAQPGSPIHLTKYMTYHTASSSTPEEMSRRADWTLDRVAAQGFTTLVKDQEQYLEQFWQRSDVRVVPGKLTATKARLSTVEMQQAIRANLFHMLQASARAESCGIAAKGLTGNAYEGHYFWDTEIYVLPFLTYTSPLSARNVLRLRYGMLEQARAHARELNHRGALFPWRTINGEEASAYYAAGTAQYHINADIMYALRKYVNITGDEKFLVDYGAEMLVETARFWCGLGFFSPAKKGKFCINGVTGPDEYNAVVNNNTYTNLMARENLRYAIDTVERFQREQPQALDGLVRKTGLGAAEVDNWKRVAENMYVPYDPKTGIYLQDDAFLDREPWDFKSTPEENYPLLLFYHPLDIYRRQVIKQADIILAMFLLGHEFSQEEKKRNFEFYDPLTTGDSSLSSCIEAVVALEIGDFDKAVEYARAAMLMDLADIGGNVKDGCHIASMGGTWMLLSYGFAGLRDYDGTMSFQPHRPPDPGALLRMPFTYRGQGLDVEMTSERTTYSLRQGEKLVIRHYDEEIVLTKNKPSAIRRTVEAARAAS